MPRRGSSPTWTRPLRTIAAPLAAILFVLSASSLPADDPPPNFILIFTDDQGYQDLGCFGSWGPVTFDDFSCEGELVRHLD